MAASPARDEKKKCTVTIPQLPTPEEPLQHSFEHSAPRPSVQVSVLSPPTSPEFSSFATATRFEQSDEVLYPDDTNAATYQPLFEDTRSRTPQVGNSPPAAGSLSVSTPPLDQAGTAEHDTTSKPKRTEPRVAGQRQYFHPVEMYNRDPQGYYKHCMEGLDRIREAKRAYAQRTLPTPVRSHAAARDRNTQDQVSSLGRPVRVEKNTRTAVHTAKPKATIGAPRAAPASADVSPAIPKNESQTKRRRRQTTTPDASFGSFPQGGAPKPRTRAPPSKAIDNNKDNSDWFDIPDRCPPISSLDTMLKSLETHWNNNNKINLDNDPDREHLHAQELEVAAILRLKCNAYLANKRRIFAAKLQALQDHKEFNKTSAQTCTNIDVNKASRLWDVFHKVGWFDEKWFSQWLI